MGTRFAIPGETTFQRATLFFCGTLGKRAYAEVEPDRVRVRMGFAFVADIDRSAIASATRDDGRVSGWGAHGWAGRWLVNTTREGLVSLEVEPAHRAWVLGFPVRLRHLRLSLADRDGFLEAISR